MLLRTALGSTIRDERLSREMNLRDVSIKAFVALGYLSEIERGQKEASSEFVERIALAMDMQPSDLIKKAYKTMRRWEKLEEAINVDIPVVRPLVKDLINA